MTSLLMIYASRDTTGGKKHILIITQLLDCIYNYIYKNGHILDKIYKYVI